MNSFRLSVKESEERFYPTLAATHFTAKLDQVLSHDVRLRSHLFENMFSIFKYSPELPQDIAKNYGNYHDRNRGHEEEYIHFLEFTHMRIEDIPSIGTSFECVYFTLRSISSFFTLYR